MINLCGKKKEVQDILWTVFTSFGFSEIEEVKLIDLHNKKLFYLNGDEAVLLSSSATAKQRAEMAALCAEAAMANGLENFEISVCDAALYDLLVLFGFEKMVRMNGENETKFTVSANNEIFARGVFTEKESSCTILIPSFLKALEKAGADIKGQEAEGSLVFAEKNAEGLAYDVAYNLRVNGCIIEYYNEDGNIDDAEKYTVDKGLSCIIRVYADGKLLIKDFLKDEITETTVADFLGYYEEEEDCCCHDHHGEDCDCGHHHGH